MSSDFSFSSIFLIRPDAWMNALVQLPLTLMDNRMLKLLHFINIIWNHHGKLIQISTKMPGISSVICEIDLEFKEFGPNKIYFACKSMAKSQKCSSRVKPLLF